MFRDGRLQVQKVGMMGNIGGEVADMELRWFHGMGNMTKVVYLIELKIKCVSPLT